MAAVVRSLLLVVLTVYGISGEGYDGFKVYQVTPKTAVQAEIFHQLHNDPNFDFFKDSKVLGKPMDIMVSPDVQGYFEEALNNFTSEGLEYKVLAENVQTILDQEYADFIKNNASLKASRDLFESYQSHDNMLRYLHILANEYPHIVRLESIGRSSEGRNLLLIHIGHGRPNTPTIFIDAGIHAREWIASPAALYIISQLVENPFNERLYENVNWAIIPAINPDGYEFSRSSSFNRLWRKTRRTNPGSTCIGTDPNRNFGFMWMSGGASDRPCDDTFAGPEPFSEPETRAIQQYFLRHALDIKMYLTIHSYGNYILYPWGFTNELPPDASELQSVAQDAARAIEAFSTLGSRYTIGSSTNVLYAAAGGSDDWTKGVTGVDLSYCFELPAGGLFGFNPPATMIRPIVEETFAGIRVLGEYVNGKWGRQ